MQKIIILLKGLGMLIANLFQDKGKNDLQG